MLALCLGAAACSGSNAVDVVPAPGVKATSCGDVRIAVQPWVGYDANVAVVNYLLRRQLDCKVTLVPNDETKSWSALAAGKVDVILENWGHDDLKKKYIDTDKVAVEAGLTGNRGVIGWYVPKWMVSKYPGITDWKNLNQYSDLFVTPESGGKGQLLLGDPSFVTNDKALVKNLDLDYQVVYAGDEDKLIAAFRAAAADRTPLIGYFYSPQWLLSEVDLVNVQLPAYTPGCDADPKTVTCGYQPFDLDKIMNRTFAYSGSPAVDLVTNFQWTDADQNQVARSITEGGLSPDQAAKKWLDAHPSVWKKWLPSPA
ncbi:ABC transporter substrate-binding protein [Spongisporangium articulatum]|uniref:ABC transporter substrate-binding protein n=1 Tax=Spongisporangium articulatum TaxID=3362603 RepID=A0ABW8AIB7_9ACTN